MAATGQRRLIYVSVYFLMVMGMSLGEFQVDSRHCYQCADTSRGGDCQTKIKTMAKAAYYILEPLISAEDEAYNRKRDQYNQYVKNCTSYLENPNITYCVIETHEYRGQVNMYMRDCTDGKNFADEFTGAQRPRPDNQTYCQRKGDTGTYCVRMCRGDFCNGPRPASGTEHKLSGILLFASILTFIIHLQKFFK